ncbi:hypothetical protein PtA15_1A859 [Puccinia triticina]|uniref:Uncharacterized protein n=1 Tax=Puccinia triticina TaxID=208348 RepID=A0ABY7CAM4_9BASI|nr:uncharacterized protein PtA15_1A859 [Puccinia triticina]WAQ81517.1 hypothetical protein PtA15_1A859 [Puccinia triticina]
MQAQFAPQAIADEAPATLGGPTRPVQAAAGVDLNLRRPTVSPAVRGGQQSWPQSVQRMTHIEKPVNDEYLGEIEQFFQLLGGYAEVGEQLAYVPQPRQYVVTIYITLAMREEINCLRQQVAVPRGVTAAEAPAADQVCNWHYVPVFTVSPHDECRAFATSSEEPFLGVCAAQGPQAIVEQESQGLRDHINAQNNQFKRDYLPRDPAAVLSLESFVQRKLRHCWGRLRDLMRTSLIPPNANHPEAAGGDDRANQSHLRARIAYLRIQTITQAKAAFTVQQMDPNSIKLPTEQEVEERMLANAADDAPVEQEAGLNG